MTGTSVRDLLILLGFQEDWTAMTDQQPAYRLDLGNIELFASEVMGRSFRQIFLFLGIAERGRTLKQIRFELPLRVESVEQGVAMIVRGVGVDYEPETPVTWFALGRKWADHLPQFER